MPEAGLRRELREELGVRARPVRLIGFATDRYGPRGFPVLTAVYRVALGRGDVRPGDDVGGPLVPAPRGPVQGRRVSVDAPAPAPLPQESVSCQGSVDPPEAGDRSQGQVTRGSGV